MSVVAMRLAILLVPAAVLLVAFGQAQGGGHRRHDVYIAGFFPLAQRVPEGALGRGLMPAVLLAIKHINEDPDVLRGFRLHITWNDTEVCRTRFSSRYEGKKLLCQRQTRFPLISDSSFWELTA